VKPRMELVDEGTKTDYVYEIIGFEFVKLIEGLGNKCGSLRFIALELCDMDMGEVFPSYCSLMDILLIFFLNYYIQIYKTNFHGKGWEGLFKLPYDLIWKRIPSLLPLLTMLPILQWVSFVLFL